MNDTSKSKEQQPDLFKQWLGSEDGKNCNKPFETLDRQQPYLENRLWWAFTAGQKYALQQTEQPSHISGQGVKCDDFKHIMIMLGKLICIAGDTRSPSTMYEMKDKFEKYVGAIPDNESTDPSREKELMECLGELVAIGREREFDPIGHKMAVYKAKTLLNIK